MPKQLLYAMLISLFARLWKSTVAEVVVTEESLPCKELFTTVLQEHKAAARCC